MTDRIKSLTVVLSDDIREDDCQSLMDAILMLKGVISVGSQVSDMNHYTAKIQVKAKLRQRIFDAFENFE